MQLVVIGYMVIEDFVSDRFTFSTGLSAGLELGLLYTDQQLRIGIGILEFFRRN